MALDRANHRMFIPEPGNIRVLVYQLDENGLHVRPTADHVIGHADLTGRRRLSDVNAYDLGAGGSLAFDSSTQRLFVGDSSFAGRPGSRILVFDLHPERTADYPAASLVIGQPDFDTRTPGSDRKKFMRAGDPIVDEANQRLFVADGSRILIFDIHPDRLRDFPDAALVIGQPGFDSNQPGRGRNRFSGVQGMAFDSRGQRLFVADAGNNRILIFDVHPSRLQSFPDAVAVLGQPDFQSREPRMVGATALPEERRGLRAITPGGLGYDEVHQRLFVTQLRENRILVFDVAPERLSNDPEAIAVLGQPDFETFDPRVNQSRFGFPKSPVVDSEKQRLYVSEGFPGGNRVAVFDISPERLTNGAAAIDVVGHVGDAGEVDFDRRMANDRLDGRTTTLARAVALDPVDHRLWVADEYNNRVLGFQLDGSNRLLEREARWVFGQKDFYTAEAERTRTGINVPLAVAYDEVDKRLYVGDGWNDRVLIYDVHPDRLEPGGNQPAIAVIGQPDFETQDPRATRNRLDLAVDMGRGIASSQLPVGIAIDGKNRRAFVSDGGNNRVLVYDIHRDRLRNGPDAIAVLGQPDFTSREPGTTATTLRSPGHLDYDPDHDRLFVVDSENHRVLVFEVAPDSLRNGMAASRVLGQPDFTTTTPREQLAPYTTIPTPRSIPHPNGVAYDRVRQRLIVTDRGNDRYMVFEAAPERLTNYPEATAVLGQRNDEAHAEHTVADLSAQDQVYDPRGIAFDSENQQLYGTDSHWARLLVYNFPAAERAVSAPAGGARMFSSLDPYLAYGPVEPKTGYGRVPAESQAGTAFTLTRSSFQMDERTEQQSRMLISQATSRSPAPRSDTLVFVDGRSGARSSVFVVNPAARPANVQFILRTPGGTRMVNRALEGGAQLTEAIAVLMGSEVESGTLRVSADQPVSVTAWAEVPNRHGEQLLTLLPLASGNFSGETAVVADTTFGGGFRTEVVLLNPTDNAVSGTLLLHDEDGRQAASTMYRIEARGHYLWELPAGGLIPQSGYVVVRPAGAGVPPAASLVRRGDGGLITITRVEGSSGLELGRIPVNTMPDPIRHGRATEWNLTLANNGRQAAGVRLILKDLEGQEVDRFEQLLPAGLQRTFTLHGLFDRARFAGSVDVYSDVPIAMSARQVTTNLRGEEVLAEVPVIAESSGDDSIFPFLDGEGQSTQLMLISTGQDGTNSSIEFFKPNGERLDVILR